MRSLIGLMMLALANWVLAADLDLLSKIGAQVEQQAVLRAEFTQTKHMAALKRPLVTSGRLVFSRHHGVLWQIEKPYRISYVLSEDRIVEIEADGARQERNRRDVPGLAQVGNVFRSVLGANAASLREVFEVVAEGDTSKWTIKLKPRQPQMAKFIKSLTLSGDRFVEIIRIEEATGDETQIRFRNPQGTDLPSASELSLFNGGIPKQ